MNILTYKYKLLFTLVLYASVIIIYINFPSPDGYFLQADEGTYFRQASKVSQQGLSAFSGLTDEFRKNEHQEQLFPNPLRVGHILMATLAVSISNSIVSLSYLSLLFFVLLCLSVFVFLNKWLDERTATLAACLVCVSPLLCGLSARALSDLDSCFFHTLTLLTFIQYIRSPRNGKFLLFIIIFSASILVKETGAFFIPFYFMVMLYKSYYKKDKAITGWQLFGSLFLPGFVSGLIVILVLGVPSIIAIVEVVIQNNVSKATIIPYVIKYNSGPWYLYIIDYLLVSPFTALLFLFFLGHYLMQAKKQFVISVIIFYVLYFMMCYNFLPKNVRYAIPLDIIIRICSVLYLSSFIKEMIPTVLKGKLIFGVVILAIVSYDLANYNKFFVKGKIYDPVSYELLKAERIVPVY